MDPETQELALVSAGVPMEHVFLDVGISGTVATMSRRGDVVVELARIGGHWKYVINSVRQLREQGIRIRSLAAAEQVWTRQLDADEDAPDYFIGNLLLLVGAWCNQQELEAIRRRTKAGLDRARTRGTKLGRPWAAPPEMRELALKMRLGGSSHGEIAKALNQSRSTVRRWLRRQQEVLAGASASLPPRRGRERHTRPQVRRWVEPHAVGAFRRQRRLAGGPGNRT